MRKIILLIFLSIAMYAQAQLALELTGQPEECPTGGSLSWTVSGTTEGGSITYSISKPSDPTFDVVTTTQTSLGGLSAGNYRVVATETVSNEGSTINNQAIKEFEIINQLIQVKYDIDSYDETCGGDGSIGVNNIKGRSPFKIRLKTPTGDLLQETETTSSFYTFTNLIKGNYRVEVEDKCGTVVVKDAFVKGKGFEVIDNIIRDYQNETHYNTDCNTIVLQTGLRLKFIGSRKSKPKGPFTAEYKVYVNGNATPVVINETFESLPSGGGTSEKDVWLYFFDKSIEVPAHPGDNLRIDAKVVDACGNEYITNGITVIRTPFEVYLYSNSSQRACGEASLSYRVNGEYSNYHIEVLEAPEGFDFDYFIPDNNFTKSYGSIGTDTEQALPEGKYKLRFYDDCGQEVIKSTTVSRTLKIDKSVSYVSCTPGKGIIRLYYNSSTMSKITGIRVISAPQSFINEFGENYQFPSDVIGDGKRVRLTLPEGGYRVQISNSCGSTEEDGFTIKGFVPSEFDVPVEEFCGGFTIPNIDETVHGTGSYNFYLQKYFPETDSWGNPNGSYVDDRVSENELDLISYKTGEGFSKEGNTFYYTGKFRVISSLRFDAHCNKVIKVFEVRGDLQFNNAFSFRCANSTYDILLEAQASSLPLTYKVIRKNGQPFSIDNGENPVFEGLPGGVYDFQITDNCGNQLIRRLDIATLEPPQIRPIQICSGSDGYLEVNGVSYLNFEWYKEGEPETILSTENKLTFTQFNPETDAGTYKVRLTSPQGSSTSCVNTTLSFTIDANTDTADAGEDQNRSICYPNSAINLLDYIGPNAQTYGTFTEVTNSGALSGTNFFANYVKPGSYTFKYTVESGCSGLSEAIIVINTREEEPPVFTNCPSSNIYVSNNSMDGVAVDLPTLQAEDNCGIKSIKPTIASGSVFPVGKTKVTYTATDTSGNKAECSFNVVVATPIEAANDNYTVDNGYSGKNDVGNILENDNFNAGKAKISQVSINADEASPVVTGKPVPYVNKYGDVVVPPKTPKGDYTIAYTICEIADTQNCSSAEAKVSVVGYVCNKSAKYYGTPQPGPKTGITNLNKFRSANWLKDMKNGYLAIDAINKGMVISRNADPANTIETPVNGMVVWDTSNKCISLYTEALGWHCIEQGCND